MSLRDDAEKAFNEQKMHNAKIEYENSIKFLEKALGELASRLSINKERIVVVSGSEYLAVLEYDGITFKVEHNSEGYSILLYTLKKCDRCGLEFKRRFHDLASLGEALQAEHPAYDCKPDKPVLQQTVAARLEELIREIAQGAV